MSTAVRDHIPYFLQHLHVIANPNDRRAYLDDRISICEYGVAVYAANLAKYPTPPAEADSEAFREFTILSSMHEHFSSRAHYARLLRDSFFGEPGGAS